MAMNYARFEGPHAKPHANTRLHSEIYGSAFYGHITASTHHPHIIKPCYGCSCTKGGAEERSCRCTKGVWLGLWFRLHKRHEARAVVAAAQNFAKHV